MQMRVFIDRALRDNDVNMRLIKRISDLENQNRNYESRITALEEKLQRQENDDKSTTIISVKGD